MAHGCKIPAVVHQIIVRLSLMFPKEVIAAFTGISLRSVERILNDFSKHGTLSIPDPKQTSKRRILRDLDVEFLLGTINQSPDFFLDELQEILQVHRGVNVSQATVWRTLEQAGYTMKKVTRIAAERSAEKRLQFIARIGQYSPSQLVFVDESSVDRRTTYRGRAWAIRGSKAQRKAFFVRGRHFSVLPAISLDGVLHCNVLEGNFTTNTFKQFLDNLLDNMQAYPANNSVVVMDNCQIHRHPSIREMIENRGMHCEYLPTYSPDFNPIELAFSAMKHRLRRNGDYTRLAMTMMSDFEIHYILSAAVYAVSPHDCQAWFRYCGYI